MQAFENGFVKTRSNFDQCSRLQLVTVINLPLGKPSAHKRIHFYIDPHQIILKDNTRNGYSPVFYFESLLIVELVTVKVQER